MKFYENQTINLQNYSKSHGYGYGKIIKINSINV